MSAPSSLAGVVAGLFAGALIGAFEVLALASGGASLHVVAVSALLLVAMGAIFGVIMATLDGLARKLSLRSWRHAALVSLPALPLTSWGTGDLFEGAFAETLPGAGSAWLWMPLAVWMGLSVVIAAGWRLRTTLGRSVAVVPAAMVVVAAEAGNRLLFASGYERVHAFLIVVALGGAISLSWIWIRPSWVRRRFIVIGLSLVAAGTAVVIVTGLGRGEDRRELATLGNHGRHVVREVRAVLDFDGDGYSSLLGGGDCDDGDSRRYPGNVDTPGNAVDEDCDGSDAEVVELPADLRERPQRYRHWRQSEEATALYHRTAQMNAVVISVDALRVDEAFVGPNLRALRDRAVVFTRAFAPAAGTDLSLATFVTGLVDPFVEVDTTIVEALADTGRVVQALLPSELLRYAGTTLLTRGMAEHHVVVTDKGRRDVGNVTTSVETTDRAIAILGKLRAQQRPFLLWVHYFDVHEHLQVESRDRHLRSISGSISAKVDKYRALVKLVDREIGRLVQVVDEGDDTMVVVFSDHGESLDDDPRLPDNHGLFVYQPLVSIPALIAVPGQPAREIDEPITIADLSVTLVELLGGQRPDNVYGFDLGVYLANSVPADLGRRPTPVVLNESEQWGVVEWPYKLMVRPKDNLVELYDLSTDPKEKNNLAGEKSSTVARLRRLYAGFSRPNLDRTRRARRARERLAKPPHRRRR